jgi:hypothetical protein
VPFFMFSTTVTPGLAAKTFFKAPFSLPLSGMARKSVWGLSPTWTGARRLLSSPGANPVLTETPSRVSAARWPNSLSQRGMPRAVMVASRGQSRSSRKARHMLLV